jgi:hypothetical protein
VIDVLGTDHRVHEDVDRHVVDLRERALELAARRTIGIGEHRQHALAVAALDLDRQVERQRLELDRVQLAQALLGKVAEIGARVVDLALDHEVAARVDVDDLHALLGAVAHLVEAGHRPGLDAVDRHAELRLERPAQRRLVGQRGRGEDERGRAEDQGQEDSVQHRFSSSPGV